MLVALLYARRLYRKGNAPFWKLAAEYPDAALEWFRTEECWVVVPTDGSSPGSGYAGPFHLVAHSAGGVVKVYGRDGEFEASQQRFIEVYESYTETKTRERGR